MSHEHPCHPNHDNNHNHQKQQQTSKKKLKSFGKNHRVLKVNTLYDANGNWVATNHQETLRQLHCPAFDLYYRDLQKLCPPAEWDAEMVLFRQPLPTTIWINDTDPLAGSVRCYFESLHHTLVEPIPWYPIPGMAWRILADRTSFRKRPEMQKLRQFLIQQTALGTISRQEEVSMLPPFLLDIQERDKCLDMCASPGSKTAQMLVALGRHKMVPVESDASPFPFDYESEGLVVANELDTKRANMLVHQVKRLRLLFPFALFTNHDARFFPSVDMMGSSCARGGDEANPTTKELRFDKILCDVVCSGDGTIRKAPHIFKNWSFREAINLQKKQVQIAMRACHLLRVGGRLVYSTCSMNPIENEAVVAQIVHRTRGAMQLVDARSLLPGLRCASGLQRWVVTNYRGDVMDSPCGEAHEALFPPNTPGAYASDAVNTLDLRLCLRLLPSHCKGGSFFIAVLDKVSDFRLQKREEGTEASEDIRGGSDEFNTGTCGSGNVGKRGRVEEVEVLQGESHRNAHGKAAPPQYLAAPKPIIDTITSFYHVKNFPTQLLVVRAATGERELHLSSGSVCTIVSRSALDILQNKTDSLLVVSAGLRVFAHEHLNKGWRISSESAILFSKLMRHSPRLLRVPVSFVERLLLGGKLKDIPFIEISDESLRAHVESIDVGTVLLEIDCSTAVGGVFYSVALRARTRLQLLVDHEDLVGMKLRLGIAAEAVEDTSVSAL